MPLRVGSAAAILRVVHVCNRGTGIPRRRRRRCRLRQRDDTPLPTFIHVRASIYWAATTVATVGYGDIHPCTLAGQMLASVVGVLGVFFVALPTAILASGFVEDLEKQHAATTNSSKDHGNAGEQNNPLARLDVPLARLDVQDARFESLEQRFTDRAGASHNPAATDHGSIGGEAWRRQQGAQCTVVTCSAAKTARLSFQLRFSRRTFPQPWRARFRTVIIFRPQCIILRSAK